MRIVYHDTASMRRWCVVRGTYAALFVVAITQGTSFFEAARFTFALGYLLGALGAGCLLGLLTSFSVWRDDLGVMSFTRALAYLAFITTAALTGAFLTAKIHWWAGGMYWGPGAVWIQQEVQLVAAISVIAAPFNAVIIHRVLRFAPVRLFATA